MKIVRGQYKPLPVGYTSALRALVASTLRTDPISRPSVADILQNPLVQSYLRPKQIWADTEEDMQCRSVLPVPPLSPRPGSATVQQANSVPCQDRRELNTQARRESGTRGPSLPQALPPTQHRLTDAQQPADWMAHMQARIGAVKDSLLQAPARRPAADLPATPVARGRPREARESGDGKWGGVTQQEHGKSAASPQVIQNRHWRAGENLSPRPGLLSCF